MCHNDCRPDRTGHCTDCGGPVTGPEPEQDTTGRYCTVCGAEEGAYWSGKHCTYPDTDPAVRVEWTGNIQVHHQVKGAAA